MTGGACYVSRSGRSSREHRRSERPTQRTKEIHHGWNSDDLKRKHPTAPPEFVDKFDRVI
jgi:hypothetical protein